MNSLKKKSKKIKRKHDKKSKKGKKRRRRLSSSSSDSSTSSVESSSSASSSSYEKHKSKKRKHSKKEHKRKKAKRTRHSAGESSSKPEISNICNEPEKSDEDFSIPIHLMDNKHKAPETKEEYEKRQSIVRRVVDEETGRIRLIKGDGEVIEEMVSKDRHREINRLATQTDGQVYQNRTISQAAKK